MSSHRARKPTAHGRFVVLRGGLDLAGASASNAATRQDELDWATFAERIGFQEPDALPEDYEDRLAERIFGAEAHASDWTEASVPASGARPITRSIARPFSRGRVVAGILIAAAAVLIAWTSAGSSSRVASPNAPIRDASSPAVHAIDATSTPQVVAPPVEECRSVEPAPEPERAQDPDPGVRLAKHLERNKKKGVHASPDAARIPRSLPGDSAAPAIEEPASFVDEVIAVAASLPASPRGALSDPPQLVASVQHDADLFDSRASTELAWLERAPKTARSWGLAPTGERWLGISAQPSDVNAPRAIAVTAQLDVTRAFASF